MPAVVTKTLRHIESFMSQRGLKAIDLFRRRDLNTSLVERGDYLLSATELASILQVSTDCHVDKLLPHNATARPHDSAAAC